MPAATLIDLTAALLDTVEDILVNYSDESLDVPPRVMVTGPQPAQDLARSGQDCQGHLAVWWETLGESITPVQIETAGRPGRGRASTVAVRWCIEIARCVPAAAMLGGPDGRTIPTPAAIRASMRQPALDAWVLFHGLRRHVKQGTLFGDPPPRGCTVEQVDPVVPFGPLGGIQGIVVCVVAQVDDHVAAIPS